MNWYFVTIEHTATLRLIDMHTQATSREHAYKLVLAEYGPGYTRFACEISGRNT